MKSIKKYTGLLLALAMVFAVSMTAFAAEAYSITISNPTVDDTYNAYKIFDVTYADTNADDTNDAFSYTIKSTDAWWNDVLTYMGGGTTPAEADADTGIYTGAGITLTPAAGVADTYVVTVTTGVDAPAVNFSAPAFAEFLAGKTDDKTAAATISNYTNGDATLTVTASGAGYYLVTCLDAAHNKTTALAELNTAAPTVTITDKNVPPAFDKQQSDTDPADYTDDALDVQIGDRVDYRITSAVPDLTGYTKYTYEVSDTLTEGLTLNMDATDKTKPAVTVKVGGTAVTGWTLNAIMGTYTNGIPAESDTGTETIGFQLSTDLVGKNYTQGAPIEITYSAVVNEKAISNVETNTATLKYSNDPKDSNSTDTEEDETQVYDAMIGVIKYDGAGDTDNSGVQEQGETWEYLSGAEFVLYKTVEGANKYYQYTPPTADADAKVEWVTDLTAATHLTTKADGTLEWKDASGNVTLNEFVGLEDGTYYLLETAAPAGYNLLDEAVEVVIAKAEDPTTGVITVGSLAQPIANNAGTLLPATGGMGTAIFYILGGALAVGAAILLIVRRRMRAQK